jgi:hypothetical protein
LAAHELFLDLVSRERANYEDPGIIVALIDHDDFLTRGRVADQCRTPGAPALNRTSLRIINHVLDFIDAQAVVRDVLGITSRIVFGIPFDEIEIHCNISRPYTVRLRLLNYRTTRSKKQLGPGSVNGYVAIRGLG